MTAMLDGNTAALREHEAQEERRQRSFDSYAKQAEAIVHERLVEEGFSALGASAFLLTGDGQDLVEAEVGVLELMAFDASVDARIDARKGS